MCKNILTAEKKHQFFFFLDITKLHGQLYLWGQLKKKSFTLQVFIKKILEDVTRLVISNLPCIKNNTHFFGKRWRKGRQSKEILISHFDRQPFMFLPKTFAIIITKSGAGAIVQIYVSIRVVYCFLEIRGTNYVSSYVEYFLRISLLPFCPCLV